MRGLWIVSGAAVWALHFASVYGFAALACARGFTRAIPWTIGALSAAAALIALALVVHGYARRGQFEHWLAATVAGMVVVAIAFETLPLVWFARCGGSP